MMWKILVVLLISVVGFTWRYFILKRYNTKLLELSITDKLTGLYNRQKTDEKLMEEQGKVDRYPTHNCSIMLIDIDYFKSVNDKYGHQTGDTILRLIANILTNTLRQTDVIGRWGGEEFMVILSHSSIDQTHIVAENLRQAIESYPFELDQPITISIGIGKLKRGLSIHETIGHIDEALYEAKKGGRNRVCHAE